MNAIGNHDVIRLRFGDTILRSIQSQLSKDVPDLKDAERESTTHSLMQSLELDEWVDTHKIRQGSSPNAQYMGGEGNAYTPLLYEVAFPGRVVETNGLTDPVTGHVYWSLYADSASLGDIDLHLVVRP